MNAEMKLQILNDIKTLTCAVANKIDILDALDRDQSDVGRYDLIDQLVTYRQEIDKLQKVTNRSIAIVV